MLRNYEFRLALQQNFGPPGFPLLQILKQSIFGENMIFRLYEVITNSTQKKTGCFPSSFRTSNSNDTNLNGVPLPKHISDTLYASIIRTYKDAFTLSPKSTMSMKWALADDMNSTLRRRRSFRMDWTPKAKRKTNSSSLKRSSSMRESYRGSVT